LARQKLRKGGDREETKELFQSTNGERKKNRLGIPKNNLLTEVRGHMKGGVRKESHERQRGQKVRERMLTKRRESLSGKDLKGGVERSGLCRR